MALKVVGSELEAYRDVLVAQWRAVERPAGEAELTPEDYALAGITAGIYLCCTSLDWAIRALFEDMTREGLAPGSDQLRVLTERTRQIHDYLDAHPLPKPATATVVERLEHTTVAMTEEAARLAEQRVGGGFAMEGDDATWVD